MDATQVVAGLVVAQVEELATGIEAAVRARHVAVGFVAARFRERHDLVHPREHDDLFGAEHASGVAREPERVADGGAQRPELEAAALIGRQPVRGACRLGGFERREQEARRAPAAVERVRHGDGRELRAACDSTVTSTRPSTPTWRRSRRWRWATSSTGWKRTHSAATASSRKAAPASTVSCTSPRMRDPMYSPVAAPSEGPAAFRQHRGSRSDGLTVGRYRDALEHRREHVAGAHTAHHRFRREHETVLEHRRRERLDVVGYDVCRPTLAASARDARCSASEPRGLTPSMRSR